MNFGDPSLPERFWRNVTPIPEAGCWLWIGPVDKKGYGRFWYKKKARWAHLVVKTFQLTAHHKCYINSCVNPDHLLDVSREINSHYGHHDQRLDQYESMDVPF